MNSDSDFDPLDRILANAAQISDSGFSRKLRAQLGKSASGRNRIFAAVGGCWLVLALVFASPQAAYDKYLALAAVFTPLETLANSLSIADATTMSLPTVSVAIILFSICGAFGLLIVD